MNKQILNELANMGILKKQRISKEEYDRILKENDGSVIAFEGGFHTRTVKKC